VINKPVEINFGPHEVFLGQWAAERSGTVEGPWGTDEFLAWGVEVLGLYDAYIEQGIDTMSPRSIAARLAGRIDVDKDGLTHDWVVGKLQMGACLGEIAEEANEDIWTIARLYTRNNNGIAKLNAAQLYEYDMLCRDTKVMTKAICDQFGIDRNAVLRYRQLIGCSPDRSQPRRHVDDRFVEAVGQVSDLSLRRAAAELSARLGYEVTTSMVERVRSPRPSRAKPK
jgi:hypothetical protein